METKTLVILLVASFISSVVSLNSSPSLINSSQNDKGIVTNITRCGGFGTPIQLRVSGCEGRCQLTPGTLYSVEYDMIPSTASPSLSLSVDLVFLGSPVRLFEVILQNSSVQPGLMYTIRFSVVPNDLLSGKAAQLRAIIFHTDNRLLELCIDTEVDIL